MRVLVLHGMITNSLEYSEKLQSYLGAQLNFVRLSKSAPIDIARGYELTVFSGPQPYSGSVRLKPSQVIITAWGDTTSNTPRLIFYEVTWAPLRDEVKNRFFACFESRSLDPKVGCVPFSNALPNSDSRKAINGSLKDNLLIAGFADATLVLGPIGDVLRDDLYLAMCMISSDVLNARGISSQQDLRKRCDLASAVPESKTAAAGRALEESKFFAVTHSLGSFLLMDAQSRVAQLRADHHSSDEVLRETLAFFLLDDATIFMRANQIALLQLSRLAARCTPEPCPNRMLRLSNDETAQPLAQMTTYVAFNDVDDLLGFELPPYLPDTGLFGTLVNVSVDNPGFRIPFLFKSPTGAHINSDENPAVIEAIVEGFDLPKP